MSRKMVTIDGNQACTHVAYATSEIITIYPITPSTPMAAEADAKTTAGQKNIWSSSWSIAGRLSYNHLYRFPGLIAYDAQYV